MKTKLVTTDKGTWYSPVLTKGAKSTKAEMDQAFYWYKQVEGKTISQFDEQAETAEIPAKAAQF